MLQSKPVIPKPYNCDEDRHPWSYKGHVAGYDLYECPDCGATDSD